MDFLSTPTFNLMQKSLGVMWEKINVTAQNIANVDTPHYKAKKVEYETILRQKLNSVNNSYAIAMRNSGKDGSRTQTFRDILNSVQPVVYTDNTTQTRVDGNNVDIDYENLELARTQLQYSYMVKKFTDEYNLLKYAVTEGKG